MKFTLMGCGASGGTPQAGGFWGDCDPTDPRNDRTRASLLAQSETTNIVIDTTYDLRLHLNRYKVQKIDGAFLTHYHADHINGIEDLKPAAMHAGGEMDLYSDDATLREVIRRSPYLFQSEGKLGFYKGYITSHLVTPYQGFKVGDVDIFPFDQDHRTCRSLGFRFGDFAYSVDVFDLDDMALNALKGVDTWVIDAGSYKNEPGVHANIYRVQKWAEILKPRITYITAMSSKMDYRTLCDELPPHIRPAYDGLEIVL